MGISWLFSSKEEGDRLVNYILWLCMKLGNLDGYMSKACIE